MKKIHLFIWIVIFGGQLSAQTIEDLLYKVENQTGKTKIETLLQIGQIYLKTAPPKAVSYLEKALAEAKNLNDTQLLIRTYLNLTEAIQEQYNYAIQYQAKEGELISNICKRFGITREELTKNNYLPEDKEVIGSYRNTFEISSSLYFIQPLAFKQVAEYYEEALKLRRTQNNNNYLIFTLKKAGDFYVQEQQFDKAEKHYLEWLEIRRTQKDTTKLVWVLRHLADFYRESEQNSKAQKLYDEIIALDKIRKDKNGFANTLAEISLIYPEPLTAEKYFHQALKFWIEVKNQAKIEWMRDRDRFQAFQVLKVYFEGENAKEREENYLLERLEMSKISMDTVLIYRAYKRLIHFYIGDEWTRYKSKIYLDSLWTFTTERKSFVKSLAWKGNIIDRIGTYAVSYANSNSREQFMVDYLYLFKDYFETNKLDSYYLFDIYRSLDSFYRKVENYDSSAYFFKKGNIDPYPEYMGTTDINDLAFLYQKANNYPKALLYFNKALEIQKSQQNSILESEQLNKIGYLYEQKLDLPKMNEYYQKAWKNVKKIKGKEIAEQKRESMNLTLQFWRIAKLYDNKENIKKAIQFMEKSVEISQILDKYFFRERNSNDIEYPETKIFEKYLEKLKNKNE